MKSYVGLNLNDDDIMRNYWCVVCATDSIGRYRWARDFELSSCGSSCDRLAFEDFNSTSV